MKHLPASAMAGRVKQVPIHSEADILSRQPCPAEAPRQQAKAARVRWCDPAMLSQTDMAQWQRVADGAAQANIFARPTMVLPAIAALGLGSPARIALVYGDDSALIGVAPIAAKPLPGRIAIQAVGDWGHANGFLCPLAVAAGREREFWQTLLAALPGHAPKARCVAFDGIVEDSPAHHSLLAVAAASNTHVTVNQRIVRAMLETDEDAQSYWEASVRAKKRKELRRQWSRLAELGCIEHGPIDLSAAGHAWMDEFLTLEASGWKGKAGSALASSPGTEQFFRRAMERAQADGQVCVAELRLDGRAIAMLITLIDGSAGFSFKTAFDEDYARFSPGVLLQREALGLLRARNLAWIDSCAAQDHPMIDSLWRERRSVIGISLPLPGLANRLAYHGVMGATRVWHAVKSVRKRSTPKKELSQ